jgi:hypothetical protein
MTGRQLSSAHGSYWPKRRRSRNGEPARNNVSMAYQLRILDSIAGTEPASLAAAVGAATVVSGAWERFVEVRMSAGPTVRITSDHDGGYEVLVNWGAQHGSCLARAPEPAIECADRLAYVFYQMREAKLIQLTDRCSDRLAADPHGSECADDDLR